MKTSTTGFSDKVLSYVISRNKALVLPILLVILVDPVKNAVYHPESPYTEAYLRIFELEVPEIEEKVVLKVLKDLYDGSAVKVGRGYAALDGFSRRAQHISLLARLRVLNRLREYGDIEIEKVEGRQCTLFKKIPTRWRLRIG